MLYTLTHVMKKSTFTLTLLGLLLFPGFAYAEEIILAVGTSSVSISTSTASSTPPAKPFTICSQEAIERRDTNIASSRSTYNIAMTNALTERKNREKAAVAIENEEKKKDAIRLSVDSYKNQTKAAQNTLTQTRKALWQTFENDIKNCRDAEESVISKDTQPEEKTKNTAMKKPTEEVEVKTMKETIKDKIETFFSLFNNN